MNMQVLKHKLVRAALGFRKREIVCTEVTGNRFSMHVGGRAYFLEADRDLPPFKVYDFAAWAVAMLAMRRGIPVQFDLPVSESTALALARASALWAVRHPRQSHPLDMELINVVSDPVPDPSATGGLLCLSGGIDSTHAAIEATKQHGYDRAMMLHGFDFRLRNDVGFGGRHASAVAVAEHFGLDMMVVRTDLTRTVWPTHVYTTMLLHTCSLFAQPELPRHGFSADQSASHTLFMHPHSNSAGIEGYYSTPSRPVDFFGAVESRAVKLRDIYEESPDLLRHMGFCLLEYKKGGNCGVCEKCVRTRLSMDIAGLDQTLIFPDRMNPSEFYETMQSEGVQKARITLARLEEFMVAMPRGADRDRMLRTTDKMRADLTGHRAPMPSKLSVSDRTAPD